MPKLTNRQRGRCKRGHEFAGENIMIGSGGIERCRICWERAAAVAHRNRDAAVRAKREMSLKTKIRIHKQRPQTPLTQHALQVAREKLRKMQRPPNPFPAPKISFQDAPPAPAGEMSDEEFDRLKRVMDVEPTQGAEAKDDFSDLLKK